MVDKCKEIQIIETNRSRNEAYIAISEFYECNKRPVKFFNCCIPLDKVECYLKCKFDDGDHPFIGFTIDQNSGMEKFIY
jgi:hypothetical protein